jgi:CheY-like chemotaxis protein
MDSNSKKRYFILLVEDNVLNQRLVTLQLNRLGFSIDIANNGVEAIEKYKTNEYDFILMDLMMPIMNGFEATHCIRQIEEESGKHVPIIGLTANTFDADREKCLNRGMDEYLAKPFDINSFFKVLKVLGISE